MLQKNQEPKSPPINVNTNFPLHTMKSDAENVSPAKTQDANTADKTTALTNENASPFFTQEEWQKSAAEQKKEPISDEKKSGISRSIVWGIIIFAALAVTAGAYYFWITRTRGPVDLPLDSLPSASDVTQPPPIQFSTNTPNYLMINDTDLPLSNFLNEYSHQILDSGLTAPVEFILTDSMNDPVSFRDFAAKFGVTLPENIINQIKPLFSLYLFNNQGEIRIGLALSEVSGTISPLQAEILKEELNLVRYFQPLFLLENAEIADNFTFRESNYEANIIKYVNLTPDNSLSVDYTFKNGQWLISTSKATLRAMLDNIGKNYQPID